MSEDQLPENRKYEHYKLLEEKLHEFFLDILERMRKYEEGVNNRLQRFIAKALLAFAVLGFISAGSIFGFGWILTREARLSKAIQEQRYDTLLSSCLEQNDQHDRAYARAEALFGPEETTNVVKLLIDELQPYEKDCVAWTKRRVKGYP